MRHPESLLGLLRHWGRQRHLGQRPAIRPPEAQRSVGPARDLVALLVHGPVVPAAEQREIRERCQTAVRPVPEMMPLAEADPAAGEAAPPVPRVERPPQGGGNGPGPGPDLQQAPVIVVAHHHPARVARQALGRFRGTHHVSLATPPGPETQYDRARRVQRSIALLVPESPSRNLTRGVARHPIVSPQRTL